MAKRILLVDDEPLILKGLKYSLEQDGYETDSAMDGEEALAKFESSVPQRSPNVSYVTFPSVSTTKRRPPLWLAACKRR